LQQEWNLATVGPATTTPIGDILWYQLYLE